VYVTRIPTQYRKDIQVLRGIAVLSVVLFHARESFFSMGYLGVDVFFVISGFVVTPLIIRIFDNQGTPGGIFSNLLSFYRRRFYRLAPALGATLAISAIAIFLVGNLYDHERFARQGIATLLLLGNIGAFRYSGNYFSPNPNPLVHTWSLSVEEQIYLILPLIIILVVRKRKQAASKILFTLFTILLLSVTLFIFPQLLNFLYTYVGVHDVLSMNFYSPFSRIWQFCLGGVIYYITQKKSGEFQKTSLPVQLVLTALLLFLVIPHIQLDTRVSSLIASAIAACVIFYRSLLIVPTRISNILEWCGDRSYSIYLVHMPLIYIAKYSPLPLLESNRKYATVAAVILSIFLGHISFKRVEEKYRKTAENETKKNYQMRKLVLVFILFPGFLFGLMATASNHNYDSHQVFLKGCVDTGFDPATCLWKSPQNKGLIMVVGDSQAYGNADGVILAGNSLGFNVLASSSSGCPFLDVQTSGGDSVNCKIWQNEVMNFIGINKPDVVVIANRTNGYINPASGWRMFLDPAGLPVSSRPAALTIYENSIKRILGKLTESGSRVLLFQNIPEPATVGTNSIMTKLLNRGKSIQLPLASLSVDKEVVVLEENIAKDFSGVRLLNPVAVLCPKNECAIIEKGRDVYRDNWHLSEYGSLKLAPMIGEILASSLNQ
jgi:peptidoglycan/LPS O-acetylase OafA/YrhL